MKSNIVHLAILLLVVTKAESSCPVGKFGTDNNCKDCPQGKFQDQDQENESACKDCPQGEFQNQKAQSACKQCPQGKFQDAAEQAECKDCDAGTIGTAPNACTLCAAGKYSVAASSGTDDNSCTACGPDSVMKLELVRVTSIKSGVVKVLDETGAVSCKDLLWIDDWEIWEVVLLFTGVGLFVGVVGLTVLRRTGMIVGSMRRSIPGGEYFNHPPTAFDNAPVSPRAMEMSDRSTAALKY